MAERETALIVGAGGAIGHAMLNTLAESGAAQQLFATHRNPVCSSTPEVQWLTLDYGNEAHIEAAARQIEATTDHLDLAVFASGVLHGPLTTPEKKMGDWSASQMRDVMWVNAGAPLTLFTRLERLFRSSQAPKVMFLSAQIGSIGDNGTGGWYSYRMSKAALNMGVRTAAIEAARWRNGAAIMAVHPGTTVSGLSRPFTRRRANLQTAAEAGDILARLLLDLTPEHNGTFLDRSGEALPW